MATLKPYVSELAAPGARASIWAQIVFFFNVGSGSFIGFSDYSVKFAGYINTAFYKGTLDIDAKLLDENPEATCGPASFSINGASAVDASYRVDGNALVITAKFSNGAEEVIRVERSGDGRETYLGLSGAYGVNVHLAPA